MSPARRSLAYVPSKSSCTAATSQSTTSAAARSQTPMRTLETLPPELIEAILSPFTSLRTVGFGLNRVERLSPAVLEARLTLRHLSATSTALRRIVQPLLFRVFDGCVSLATLSLFLRSILARDDLRHAVRTIHIFALASYYPYDKEPLSQALRLFANRSDPEAWMRNFVNHSLTQPAVIMALLLLSFPNLQALQTPWPVDYEHIVTQWVLESPAACPRLTALAVHTPGNWPNFEFGQAGGLLKLNSLRRVLLRGVGFRRDARFAPKSYHVTHLELDTCMVSAPVFEALVKACIVLKSVKVHLVPTSMSESRADEVELDVNQVVLTLLRHRKTLRCLHINFEQSIAASERAPEGGPMPGLTQLEALEELQISVHALMNNWGPLRVSSLQGYLPLSIQRLILIRPDPYCFQAVEWLADPGPVVYSKLEWVHLTLRRRLDREEYAALSPVFQKQGIRYTMD